MKLNEILKYLEDKPYTKHSGVAYDVHVQMGIDENRYNYHGDSDVRAKSYVSWTCTDTPVGFSIIYFNDKPIMTWYKPYRKSDPQIAWIDKDETAMMTAYMLSIAGEDMYLPDKLEVLTSETEIQAGMTNIPLGRF